MTNFSLREAAESLELNKNNLDEANFRQPQMMWLVSQEHARANAKVRELTRDKANLGASLDRQIRDSRTKLDAKITEKEIEMTIRDHEKMRDMNGMLLEAQEQVDLWAGMLTAYSERGRAIREGGEQYRSNYFTTESGGRESREAKQKQADSIRAQAGQRFRRER